MVRDNPAPPNAEVERDIVDDDATKVTAGIQDSTRLSLIEDQIARQTNQVSKLRAMLRKRGPRGPSTACLTLF